MSFSILKAEPDDLAQIKYICQKYPKELGFVKRGYLAESIERGCIFVAKEADLVIGFVEYRQRKDEQTTLYHLAAHPEHHKRGVAKALIDKLAEESRLLCKEIILLKCPEEMPANNFYEKYGFELIRIEPGKNRKVNVWRLNLY